MPNVWTPLRTLPDDRLAAARLQAHWAAQVVASVGYTFIDPAPSWAHLSLSFSDGRLWSRQASRLGFSASLDIGSMSVDFHNPELQTVEKYDLRGRTLDDAYSWLASAISRLHADLDPKIVRPAHELPDHPVRSGAEFNVSRPGDFEALSGWFHNANLAINSTIGSEIGASPVRCWPHHFDIASLITIDPDLDPETARSIGVGMSPGDTSYGQPYFYVTPWPHPAAGELPEFGSKGFWHTKGWIGAILTAETITSGDSSGDQEADVSNFLRNAIGACRNVLDARSS